MNWIEKDPANVLKRTFLFGLTGILLCMVPLINAVKPFMDTGKGSFINGAGLALQLLALSMAILVIRKRKISHEIKEKAKRMIIILAVALVFFILNN